jgi:hypothetical protein
MSNKISAVARNFGFFQYGDDYWSLETFLKFVWKGIILVKPIYKFCMKNFYKLTVKNMMASQF